MPRHSPDQARRMAEALRNTYVFARADEKALAAVVEASEMLRIADRSEIIAEGAKPSGLFVLVEGRLVVKQQLDDDRDLIIARVNPPNVVGELSYVDQQVASATIRADGPCTVVRVPFAGLDQLFLEKPELESYFNREIVRTVSDRLRKTNKDLLRSITASLFGAR